MTAADLWYFCLDCDVHGNTSPGDRGEAAKHVAATTHGVMVMQERWGKNAVEAS